ncbi:MAG: LPS assembly lipoprotein LptE [Chlamydiales bacterium]
MKGVLLFLGFLLTSCGYQFGDRGMTSVFRTVSIPYVEGDAYGLLTNSVVRNMSCRGGLSYSSSRGDLSLCISLSAPKDENVGFIYAEQPNRQITNIIVPYEARVTLSAKVTLVDNRAGCTVMGPVDVSVFLDYDFSSDLTNVNFHTFSLGQLEMHNIAENIAIRSLYDKLAEKIVDYVAATW